jgi:hypothetical protein
MVVAALAVFCGCASTHPVRCDGHLVPINPPPAKPTALTVPAKKSAPAQTSERPP